MTTTTTQPLRAVRLRTRGRGARSVRYGLAALLAAVVTVALPPSARGTSLSGTHLPSWHMLSIPSGATFRALAAVSRKTAWIGSDDGTVVRTVDGGRRGRMSLRRGPAACSSVASTPATSTELSR